ncbi:MAG: cytochrome B [Cyanobacteriota bacterium]|nr:cytochrome B [Cyanobacteriota bacterium]
MKASPYQPSLLRLLHGVMMLLVPLAWLSGLVVAALYDGRWGRLPVQPPGDWIDIHGTLGVLLWPLALLFGAYAISVGRFRLRHAANAAPLLALALAIGSGKCMDEQWLRRGELHHLAYNLHLVAWALLAVSVVWHGGSVLQRGGRALAGSMTSLAVRSNDGPRQWPAQLRRWWRGR